MSALVAALVALGVFVGACGGGGSSGSATPGSAAETATQTDGPLVVTTVAPITSLVARVAGDRARVVGIVPEGANSHTFEPAPGTAKTLAEADIIFVNGLMLEEPTAKLARATKRSETEIVELGTRTLPEPDWIFDFSFPKSEGKPNPHLWTNPPMARRYAEVARDELIRIDPRGASDYRANFDVLADRIDELDRAMRTAFATVAPEKRKLLTYHDAYAYFARDYGWEVIGAIQVSDFADPTAKEVAALIDQVRGEGVPAIFGSEVFPSPVLEQIGHEADVQYVDVLRDDDLPGSPGDAEHSWLGLMRYDYMTMTEAMDGDGSALAALRFDGLVADRARYPQ